MVTFWLVLLGNLPVLLSFLTGFLPLVASSLPTSMACVVSGVSFMEAQKPLVPHVLMSWDQDITKPFATSKPHEYTHDDIMFLIWRS